MKNYLAVDIKNTFFGTDHVNANKLTQSPGTLVNNLIPNAIIAVGLIFLFMILFSGFKIVVGAGANQSAQDAAKAKAALTWSVVGFLLVVFSYFILTMIGAFLGFNTFTDSHF